VTLEASTERSSVRPNAERERALLVSYSPKKLGFF
jgi:hypothetical protein